jgi:hypothetical protein
MVKSNGYALTINNPKPARLVQDNSVVIPAESDFVTTLRCHDMTVGKEVVHYIVGYEGGYSREAYRKNNFREMKGYKPLTPHLQCAIFFREPKSFKEVKKIFPRAHIERLRLPYVAAWFYCKKEGVFDQRGNFDDAMKLDTAARLKDPQKFPIGYDTDKGLNPLEPVMDAMNDIARIHYGDSKVGSTD